MFIGVSSCAAAHVTQAVQEAMVEAAVKARNLGFSCILFLSDSKRTVEVTNNAPTPCWQEQNMMADPFVSLSKWTDVSFLFCSQGYNLRCI